ncbi:MAG: (d)CMP kinase [Candidatus Thiodiazotropha sp. (ex Lucinoma borealis)]|nr:(d)CMP kinase [Candidatus Thiodiazotropha sp. (ex Lucinoma borealis)]MCU7837765.1 (d)CMP kinase [Candidatus Thiodiazotropha sp. (ex Troendleina suluensis)]MCU7854793.1 (d)CMP kinase [Candidatus Thiodiazotropha sp. (ex Lucinoma borealis)]MCU7867810.1 (d)CMP kinase [Candidatus Thiodiazotropha sp. (ex Lucinoma borealis)]
MGKVPVITIDGPSGSGKGTLAQRVAETLGWHFLDSGAIYRVLGIITERADISVDCADKIAELAANMPLSFIRSRTLLGEEDVSDLIRTETAGNAASKVAAIPQVRHALLEWQRDYAKPPGLVADGRDMGTVVFPSAEVKIFLTASAEERALRRYKQLKEKGLGVNLARLTEEIRERDERDSNRSAAPLTAADQALQLDSTAMAMDEVFQQVMQKVFATLPNLRQ